MKTSEEIRSERDRACSIGHNAGNCLGGLYNLLRDIPEYETVAKAKARRDNCVDVLNREMAEMRMMRDDVLKAIDEQLENKLLDAIADAAMNHVPNGEIS